MILFWFATCILMLFWIEKIKDVILAVLLLHIYYTFGLFYVGPDKQVYNCMPLISLLLFLFDPKKRAKPH